MEYIKMIDAFLSGDLSPEENAAFLEALKKDTSLQKEVALHQDLDAALHETDVIDLRAKLQTIHTRVAINKNQGLIRQLFATRIVQLAAAVITLLIISTTVYQIVQDPGLSTDELYEMYYQPDDAVMFMRSGTTGADDGLLMEALRKYEQQDYQGALQLFKKDESSLLVHFYSGLAYMEIEMFDEAILSFQKVLDDGNSLFVEQSKWYQGLCYLKSDRLQDAKVIFANLSGEGSTYKPKIDFILDNLKK